ncbi:uncharacterized protein LOC134209690 [Armigeres subalbatus]|uniref:uncharacterized protein LOC134209690 n=1 Tax=Armigeres subalbatus TaxID=124917 RepID=UPI002ED0E902
MSEEVLKKRMGGIIESVALLESYKKDFDKEKPPPGHVQAWSEKLESLYELFHRSAAEYEALPREEENPLPELNLPKFSGKLEDWCAFRDLFDSAVGSRTDIGSVEKLQYLKGSVQGEAARLLEPIKTSEQGYRDAWRTLRLRYENKRQLIKCHIRMLFEVPFMKKESADKLLGLVDRFEQQISVLKSLGEPADKWSSIIYICYPPAWTLRTWECHCAKMDSENVAAVLGMIATKQGNEEVEGMPSYVLMVNFLQNHARVLRAASLEPTSFRDRRPKVQKSASYPVTISSVTVSSQPLPLSSASAFRKCCMQCVAPHFLYHCPMFQKPDFKGSINVVRQHNLCLNCLRSTSHFARDCPAQGCHRCQQRHHTILHVANSAQRNTPMEARGESSVSVSAPPAPTSSGECSQSGNPHVACVASTDTATSSVVFLPTALVNIRDSKGAVYTARCLLDSASQHDFIAQRLCDRLKLPRLRLPVPIRVCGIGGATTSVTHQVVAALSSRVSPFAVKANALVLPTITVRLPQTATDLRNWSVPDHVDLADPTFAIPGDIDVILGSTHFFRLLRYGSITIGDKLPTLQRTEFGWVVSGGCTLFNHDHSDPRTCHFSTESTLEELVHRFWSLEELHDTKGWSPSERFCEKHFVENTTRNPDGRYVVKLPKREELLWQLDSNHYNATRRFYALERSLSRDPEKKAMYFRFIQQYVSLGHMRAVTAEELDVKPQYVLPHHAVMKPESTTTKLRTVFDASCRSRTGLSLNDVLIAGPTIQDELVCLVLRFRMYRFVVSADIEKMFRQILVHPSDQPLLRILWRGDKDSPLTTFQLLTVTYGTNSAPFLAARTLQKLADDEESRFPLAAPVVRNDFYVDNLLTGADNISDLIVVCEQLIRIMNAAGMSLRQWSSNSQEILDTIPVDLRETETILELDRESFVTALGLRWEPSTDLLSFKQRKWVGGKRLTKRIILSFISSLLDPPGLIGPFIVKLKILLQMLWKLELDWDIEVPAGFARTWSELQQSIHLLSQLKIPRQIVETNARLEIHGFCDASLDAYGACLYLRSVLTDGIVTVHLVTAKSKVAPLGSQSIPRLELCAALLLAHLLTKFSRSVDINSKVYLWSDSTIVLNWLAATPSTWEVYVANRVAEIQELTAHACWHHVASGDNPADLISRGTTLDVLLDNSLWWHGAPWLTKAEEEWPQSSFAPVAAFEMGRRKVVALPVVVEDADIIDRYSSLSRLLRISSWCHRFVGNIRRKAQGQQAQSGPLMPEEIDSV